MENVFTLSEVAGFLGVSRVRVWQLIKEKKLEARMLKGRWFVKRIHLHAFIADQERKLSEGKTA